MDESTNHEDRPAKRCKLAGTISYGTAPTEFTGYDKEKMVFLIHNFAELQEKRTEFFFTKANEACGQEWKLLVYPRGDKNSKTDAEYTSVFLACVNKNIETNPVIARGSIRTKTKTHSLEEKYENRIGRGSREFKKREDIIRQDLNKQGTLTIEVELEVATEKRKVWSPNTSNINKDVMLKLYESIEETSDVTFLVGPSKVVQHAHKNILAVQARDLYDLVITEEASSSSPKAKARSTRSQAKSENSIVLQDVDANAFEAFLKFVYGIVPDMINAENGEDNDDDGDVATDTNEAEAKLILLVADRFGCTDLKLHMESYLIRKVLVPSKAARLLLLADSHSCALLKEAAMKVYITDPKTVMEAHDDWKTLQESTKLLTELLVYATLDRSTTTYSSVVSDGDGTVNDADGFDVTSLRERLEAYDLDLDGSREMLLHRWKNYLGAQRGDDGDVDSNNVRS